MELRTAINKIFEKKCLLFLGAGFSRDAINIENKPITTAKFFSDTLDELTGIQNEGDLGEAAQCYIDEYGEYQLVPLLQKTFKVKSTTQAQDIIGSCIWSRIYTTNYDDVIEFASLKHGRQIEPVTLSSRTRDYKDKQAVVVHLNGNIQNLNQNVLSDEFKLSTSSYTTQSFLNSEWITLFRYDIEDADAIFFVGCSLQYDLDIKRLISEDSKTKDKCFFIMAQDEKESNVRKASRLGRVETIGVDKFAQLIEEARKDFIPSVTTRLFRPLCFDITPLSTRRPILSDTDIHKLYYYGDLSQPLVQYSLLSTQGLLYYVKRSRLEETVRKITENKVDNILVHSDLGNGKTLFLEGLAISLQHLGYTIYTFKRYRASLNREIEEICKIQDNKVAIIVENYATNMEVISIFSLLRTDQLLIVSERTVNNDMAYDRLFDKIKSDFYSVDLNVLDSVERKGIVAIFNQYGLWSFMSAHNDFDKEEYISRDCRNTFRGVLLGLLRSPNILSKFKKIISAIQQKRDFYESMVLILASKIFDLNLSIEMLSTALDDTILGNPNFKRNEIVRELFNFHDNEIKVKSSVLAEVLLEEIIDTETIKDVLVKTFKNFDKHRYDLEYKRVLRTLLSFTTLKRVLSQKGNNKYQEVMASFFEDVRNCTFCQSNPHYWLQYAILKLDQHDFTVADTFFQNAYSFAARREDFDTYQIDNHYARYLLLNAIEAIDEPEFMMVFKKAHDILIEPGHQKDTKYYPFKVAQNYLPFYKKYKSRMKDGDKEYIYNSCRVMLDLIARFVQSTPKYKYRYEVKTAKMKLEELLSDAT